MPKSPTYSNETLIEILCDYAHWLGRAPTYREIDNAPDTPSGQTYCKRFGSWRLALHAAGMEPGAPVIPTRDEIIAAFERVIARLERMPYASEWPYPAWIVRHHFASVQELMVVLDHEPPRAWTHGRDDLLRWVAEFIQRNGYAPLLEDLPAPKSLISEQFGSYPNLLAQLYLQAISRQNGHRSHELSATPRQRRVSSEAGQRPGIRAVR